MEQALQQTLVRRVLAHLEQRTTDSEPAPSRLPFAAYADADRLAREQLRLFRELPLAIAHASQLAAPGDFLTHDRSGVPLLVVRGDDGELRAFVNVCRHRGTRVEPSACGSRKAFVCPYHAWTYGCDGALLGIPHERGFSTVDRSTRGLVRVPAAEHAGLVFVQPTPRDAPLAIADYLGAFGPDLVTFGLPAGHVHAPRTVTRELSWKLAVDIFLETYHLKPTHKRTIYPMFFDNVGLVDFAGAHIRETIPKRSIRELPAHDAATWSLRHHANVLYQLFPNTLVLVEPDHFAVVHFWPDGPARTIMTTYMVVPEPPATDKARAYWDANNTILLDAVDEDLAMGESIQRGVAAMADHDVVFGAFEHALRHFHAQIERFTSAD
jgi:phenylpropionate dioxygenase-like ring-hydroxylating dioxygenase large terminal subunit